MAKYYAWSDLYNGGKVEEVKTPTGGIKVVVVERYVTHVGESVTKAKLGVSDEEWDHLVESGSIRDYPLPKDANDLKSPSLAFMESISTSGEIDVNKLLELGLKHPPALNPPAEEAAELPEGT